MKYNLRNILYINWLFTNFLLTEREVCTEKYRTEIFFVQTESVGRGLYKKIEIRYFSVAYIPSKRGYNKKFIISMAFIGIYILETNKKCMI